MRRLKALIDYSIINSFSSQTTKTFKLLTVLLFFAKSFVISGNCQSERNSVHRKLSWKKSWISSLQICIVKFLFNDFLNPSETYYDFEVSNTSLIIISTKTHRTFEFWLTVIFSMKDFRKTWMRPLFCILILTIDFYFSL